MAEKMLSHWREEDLDAVTFIIAPASFFRREKKGRRRNISIKTYFNDFELA